MIRPTASRRRGASLIEMVLIMASMTILMGICGMFFHLLLRLERSGRTATADARIVARLARQFRDDVHAARSAKAAAAATPESTLLELSGEGTTTVVYALDAGRLVRIERAPGRPRREAFLLDHFAVPRFEAAGKQVRMLVPRSRGENPESFRPGLRIEAILGKHANLSAPTETAK